MGWDIQRFVDRETIVQDIICSVCTDVVQEPVQTPCDHVFCSECIIRWLEEGRRTCPIDRQDLTFEVLKPPNRVITQLINKLTIRCRYFDKGCKLMCKLEDILHLMEHEQNGCPFSESSENSGPKREVAALKRQNSELTVEKNLRAMAIEEKNRLINEKQSEISDLEKRVVETKRTQQEVWRVFQGKIEQLANMARQNIVDDNRVSSDNRVFLNNDDRISNFSNNSDRVSSMANTTDRASSDNRVFLNNADRITNWSNNADRVSPLTNTSDRVSTTANEAGGACQLSHICMSDHEAGRPHVFAAPKCLRGHTMIIDACHGFTCDLCFIKREREPRWRCDECDDDFCFNCYPI